MNNEVEFQKVQEVEFHSTSYILTLRADAHGLLIEMENKLTADLWESFYEPASIEHITSKTGNTKRFNVFVKMLMTALKGSSDSLQLDLLTHQDIEMQQMRKGGSINRATDPKVVRRRYLIMSYMAQFDKVLYPIPLNFNQNPTPERLKITIHRLSQELQYAQPANQSNAIKQFSAVKHENQLLKSRLSSFHKGELKENHNLNNPETQALEEQIRALTESLASKQATFDEELLKKDKIIEGLQKKIEGLENKAKKQSEVSENVKEMENAYEQKFNRLEKETEELISSLQHARETEKKAQIKIENLEKQLEKMIDQSKRKVTSRNPTNVRAPNQHLRSPAKSNKSYSVHSSGSKTKPVANKANNVRRNSSVYDSDTQSSRMRRANNNRASPYRQAARPVAGKSTSAKKKPEVRGTTQYNNISNLNNANKQNARARANRSRSRSQQGKSVKRKDSPPTSNIQSSVLMTETNGYITDEEEEDTGSKAMDTMDKLRKHRAEKMREEKRRENGNPKKSIQDKISSIASALQKFKKQNE